MGVSRERAAIVPRGVDTGLFTPDGPPADRPATGHRVVAVGRLLPRKGFELLISALRGLADTELLIVGGPDKAELDADPEAVRLLAHAERAGVADRVRLFGRVTHADLPALLRSADVVACAPWCEPFGMAAVEAMACGVPVVATSVGGLTDSVVDGVTGVLVPPGSPTALSHAIRRLLADGNRRAALAAAGRDRACSRYCWAQVTEETTREYERATGVARTHAVEPEEKQVSTGWPGETQG
jgi:glycosyltransferase involved in cell wall biosynthesis